MLLALFTVCFVAGNAFGSPLANQYIDSVLNNALRNEILREKLDPAGLSNFSTEFHDKIAFVKVKGRCDYSKGTLSGLSNVFRFSECQGPYYSYGAKAVNCTITFNGLKIEYDGKLKYGKVPAVNIKGKANITNTLIFIEIANQGIPTLKNFIFTQVGMMSTKFTGLGPLNKYTKFLDEGFRSYAQAEVFKSMSQRFQYALNKAVGQLPMPN